MKTLRALSILAACLMLVVAIGCEKSSNGNGAGNGDNGTEAGTPEEAELEGTEAQDIE